MTRKTATAFSGWLCGLILSFLLCVNGSLGFGGYIFLAAWAAVLGMSAVILKLGFKYRALLFFGAFAAALAYSGVKTALVLVPLEALDGQTVTVVGRVCDYTEGDRARVVIKGTAGGYPGKFSITLSGFGGGFGDEISLEASVSKISDSDTFSARTVYLPDGIYLSGTAVSDVTTLSPGGSIADRLREYGRRVSREIRREVGGEAGELLAASVTGDSSAISDALRSRLNRSGIAHLAAVSGLHVSAAAFALMYILRRIRAPRSLSAAVCGLSVMMFAAFSGFRVSAVRAGIMVLSGIAAFTAHRRQDTLTTLSLSGFVITLADPFAAADVSLLLSLAGVFGVGVAAPAVIKAVGLKNPAAVSLCGSACASAATAPIAIRFYGGTSLLAPLTNLLAVPLCSLSLVFGMIYAALGTAFSLPIKVAGALCEAVTALAGGVSSLGFSYLCGGGLAIAAAISAIAVFTVYFMTSNVRKTAFSALCLALITVSSVSFGTLMTADRVDMYLISDGNGRAAVLHKAGECIIIDFDGTQSAGVTSVLDRVGASGISAAILYDKAEASLGAYKPVLTGSPYYPEAGDLSRGEGLFALGLLVTADGGGFTVNTPNRSVTVSADGSGDICLLNGITVEKLGGSPEASFGSFFKKYNLGVIKNGG